MMEPMDAGALTEYLPSETQVPLSEGIIAHVCQQVLNALCFMHASHMMHRDIKSDNILLNSRGEIKLGTV